jgi:hypothetical protein
VQNSNNDPSADLTNYRNQSMGYPNSSNNYHFTPNLYRYPRVPLSFTIQRLIYQYSSIIGISKFIGLLIVIALLAYPSALLSIPQVWRVSLGWISLGAILSGIFFSGWSLVFRGFKLVIWIGVATILGKALINNPIFVSNLNSSSFLNIFNSPSSITNSSQITSRTPISPPVGFEYVELTESNPSLSVDNWWNGSISQKDLEDLQKKYSVPLNHTEPMEWQKKRAGDDMFFGSKKESSLFTNPLENSEINKLIENKGNIPDIIMQNPHISNIVKKIQQ